MIPKHLFVAVAVALGIVLMYLHGDRDLYDWRPYVEAGKLAWTGFSPYHGITPPFLGPPWVAWAMSWVAWVPAGVLYAGVVLAAVHFLQEVLGERGATRLDYPRALLAGILIGWGIGMAQWSPLLTALVLLGRRLPAIGPVFYLLAILIKPPWFVPIGAILLADKFYVQFVAIGTVLAAFLFWNVGATFEWQAAVTARWEAVALEPASSAYMGQWGTVRWSGQVLWPLVAWAIGLAWGQGYLWFDRYVPPYVPLVAGVLCMPWLYPYDAAALLFVLLWLRWHHEAAWPESRRQDPPKSDEYVDA